MSTMTTTETVTSIGSRCGRCGDRVDGPHAGVAYLVLCGICRLIASARRRQERG